MKSHDTISEYHISGNWSHSMKKFECKNGKILNLELINDLVVDCGLEADDEPILKSILVNENYFQCDHPSELPCKEGHPRCYNLTDICMFKLNSVNQLEPCRNGGHLENCGKFECNVMFKCLHAYCIPWIYVCNGKWDCPEGYDEMYDSLCEEKKVCFFMYKCKNTSNICVHTNNLCDKNNDCPHGDDELLCDLQLLKCPTSCRYLLYSIDCNNVSLRTIENDGSFSFLSVYVFNSSLKSIFLLTSLLKDSLVVKLPRNGIVDICNKYNLKEVVLLDISFNFLKTIKNNCFINMLNLISLSLNNNRIELLAKNAFFHITDLKFLNLSNNLLNAFSVISSTSRHHVRLDVIHIANLTGNNIDDIFISATLAKVVLTENYKICCLSSLNTVCIAQPAWYRSCSELLPNFRLKIMFIAVSCAIISLNILSICLHVKSLSFYSVIVLSFNLNEIICGLYVISISVANIIYSENFYYEQDIWRSSTICSVTSGLVIWYKISSQMHNIFLSLSRFMVVIYPIDTIFKKVGFAQKILIFIYTSSFTFSILFTIMQKIMHDTQAISLCFPFVDSPKTFILIKFMI